MILNRRDFLKSATMISFGLHSFPQVRSAWGLGLDRRGVQNLYMVFNDIRDAEGGESYEFTTMERIHQILERLDVPKDATVVGIGARMGTVDNPFGIPGEFGFARRYGANWNEWITRPSDGKAVSFGLTDPMPDCQLAVVDESTGHTLNYSGVSREGSCLWGFYSDDTTRPVTRKGLHNAFSDVDGGLLENIYGAAQFILRGGHWDTVRGRLWHNRLLRFMPELENDAKWRNFASTFPLGVLHQEWLPYMRSRGWQAAAVVIEGSIVESIHFYLKEWNRRTPAEPDFIVGAGVHPPLNIQYGREVQPFIDGSDTQRKLAGFIWDFENQGASPPVDYWQNLSEPFGHAFHIHGFRKDGTSGGHMLQCLQGAGGVRVRLYPLRFVLNDGALFFHNDLFLDASSVEETPEGLRIAIENHGENFMRFVRVRLHNWFNGLTEEIEISLLEPKERHWVHFKSEAANGRKGSRKITLDPGGSFIEGGEGKENNTVLV